MNRDTLASFSKEELIALIEALTKQIGMLDCVAWMERTNAVTST